MPELPVLPARPSCTACDLHKTVLAHVGVPGRLLSEVVHRSSDTPVLICIGMNPGANEDRENRAFVGRSGEILAGPYLQSRTGGGSSLAELADIFALNCCLCSTVGGKPSARQYKTCSTAHLYPDLCEICRWADTRPVYLLALGADPVAVITRLLLHEKKSLREALRAQGQVIEFEERWYKVNLYTSYHPAYVLRYPNAILAVEDHLALLRASMLGIAPVPSKPNIVPASPPRT